MFSPIKDQIDGTSAYASSGTQQYENISMSAMKEVPKRKKKRFVALRLRITLRLMIKTM